ncbi:prosaposin-like [Amphibalanus amphitrite]|uniref:prosaposin-like n=1 Tax=Amphibalanus amphitrite TaxID=1232801 RepID=UPI001C8FE783|nr:prosaposin-like [Amphibalanus amphitrite]
MALKALFFAALVGVALCGPTIVHHGETGRLRPQLGSKRCTFGPSYWCDHVSKSSECGMTSWCISNVWQHLDLPEDNDDVCGICKEMVKEARDQLNSNETQEELKEVLEGSCNLIPLHIISEECDKLVDDFIPELTEMLSSQMNPQVVCQTAGLCNSARIDKMLEERDNKKVAPKSPDTCATCQSKMETLKHTVTAGGQQELLDRLLPVCRDFGSYSDACAGDLATHIQPIFEWIQLIDSKGVCLLGNACPGLFDEAPLQLQSVSGPAVDCDLCIHIVKHWRDILVANTTKEEFKEILDGICSKTKAWAPKCTQLVDEYYVIIYDFLVNEMRAHSICKAIGLCAKHAAETPLWAVLPAESVGASALKTGGLEEMPLVELTPAMPHKVVAKKGGQTKKKLHSVKLQKSPPHAYGNDGLAHPNPLDTSEPAAEETLTVPQQLPLERFGLPDLSARFKPNTELCDLCEFGLNELRKVLEEGSTEDEISEEVGRLCDLLPGTLTGRCHQFVTEYGSFVVQMIAQEVDPTEVCPALRLCPLPSSLAESSEEFSEQSSSQSSEEEEREGDGPGCAICEYAMNTLLDFLKDKKTEDEIRDGLDRVCEMLPSTVSRECQELVNTFMEEIIDMIVSGMTADEICITLRLCQPARAAGNDLMSNSIYAMPLSAQSGAGPFGMQMAGLTPALAGLPVDSPYMPMSPPDSSEEQTEDDEDDDHQSPACVMCEFVMMQVKMKLDDNSTDEQIETTLKKVCTYMPQSIRADCDGFIDEYGAAILSVLKSEVADPDGVCRQLRLCQPQEEMEAATTTGGDSHCALCHLAVTYAHSALTDLRPTNNDELCQLVANQQRDQCVQLMDTYGDWIHDQLRQHNTPGNICIGIDQCARPLGTVHLLGGARCLWGPAYVCQDEFHARACNALEFCVAHSWNTESAQEARADKDLP